MKVVVLGAGGFVGSAFVRRLTQLGIDCVPVDRAGYDRAKGIACDVLVNAAGSSTKYLADREPFGDFERTVSLAVRAVHDFQSKMYVLVSSVDVYPELSSPETTREDAAIDPLQASRYGFHKRVAELCVQRHAGRWLIVRLAGMLGPGLRKNPVYDILHGEPIRIHPDSRYQFMPTADAADAAWHLLQAGASNDVFNICGRGLISPREIADLAGRPLSLHPEATHEAPRIVDVSIDKVTAHRRMPGTHDTVRAFVRTAEAFR